MSGRKRPRDDDTEERRRQNQDEVDRRQQYQDALDRRETFEADAPTCPKCHTKSVVSISGSTANPNRLFYCCKNKAGGCKKAAEGGWLMWCEKKADAPPTPQRPQPRPAAAAATPERARSSRAGTQERLLDAAQEGDAPTLLAILRDTEPEALKPLLDATGLARGGSKPATPLRYAAFHGFEGCVRPLLAAGALPNLCDGDENDALKLSELGRGHTSAKGAPREREGTIAALKAAAAADAWEIHGVSIRPELNGNVVRVVDLPEPGKAIVRGISGEGSQTFKLKWEKLRRKALLQGETGTLVGLGNNSLNGCAVSVVEAMNEKERYRVRLQVDAGRDMERGTQIRVKRENLVQRWER